MVGTVLLFLGAILVIAGVIKIAERFGRGSVGAGSVGAGVNAGAARQGRVPMWQATAIVALAFVAELLYFGVGSSGEDHWNAATTNGGSAGYIPPQTLHDLGMWRAWLCVHHDKTSHGKQPRGLNSAHGYHYRSRCTCTHSRRT